jgi:hypothetical protein
LQQTPVRGSGSPEFQIFEAILAPFLAPATVARKV